MKRLFFLILIFYSFLSIQDCYAQFSPEQQRQIDSLNASFNSQIHDTDRVWTLLNLVLQYYLTDPDTAIQICHRAEKLGEKINYSNGVSEAYGDLGYLYDIKGDIELSIIYNKKSLSLYKKLNDKANIATVTNNLGLIYKNQGDIKNALSHYNKSLKIFEGINNIVGIGTVLSNLGEIYEIQGDNESALEYYNRSLKLSKKIDDKLGVAVSLNNIGHIYFYKDSIDKAIGYYEQSLILREDAGDKKGISLSLNNIGKCYGELNKNEKALQYYKASLSIREEIGDKKGETNCLISLSNIYMNNDNFPSAKKHVNKAMRMSKELGFPNQIQNAALILMKIANKENDFEEAFEMHKLFIEMRDSLNNEQTQKAAIKQQTKYEYEKQKALDDADNEKKVAIEHQEAEKQQVIAYATFGGLGFVVIFLVFVFNRLQVTRKQKVIIEETNEELNQTNEELATQRDEIEHQKIVVEEQRDDIIASINYAKRIQTALLKNEEHESVHIPPHFILFQPKDIVSGDFYWTQEKQGYLYLAAVDCTGHGVPGAFLTMLGTSFLNEINSSNELLSPSVILDKLRDKVVKELSQDDGESKDGMDISLMRLALHPSGGAGRGLEIEWAGANNPLYIIRKNGMASVPTVETIKGDREPIGFTQSPTPFTNYKLKIEKGDQIYLFTDGYADQFGGANDKKMGYKAFREKLVEVYQLPMEEQKQLLTNFFRDWKGEREQLDDVCVIGVKV